MQSIKQQIFISILKQQNMSLNATVSKLAKLWDKEISPETGWSIQTIADACIVVLPPRIINKLQKDMRNI